MIIDKITTHKSFPSFCISSFNKKYLGKSGVNVNTKRMQREYSSKRKWIQPTAWIIAPVFFLSTFIIRMTPSYTKLISGETAVQTWRAVTWNWGEMMILFFLTAWSPLWMSVDAIQSLITNGGVCFPPFFFNATAQTGRCRESLKTESVTQLVKPPTAETSNGASDWEAK